MLDLFLLASFMIGVLVLQVGLMVIFRGWMIRRDALPGGSGDHAPSQGPSGH